jgi:hypothetical protein
MKSIFQKFWFGATLLVFIIIFTSCGGSRTSAIQPKGNKAAKVGWSPAQQKKEPVRKNFIIKNKQRNILGSKPVKR